MNELKPENVMRALEHHSNPIVSSCEGCPYIGVSEYDEDNFCTDYLIKDALALLREKDAEIERLTQERDDARRDCAVAEQNHYECKKELEEMSDDILDSVRAERDRYKAESEQYQSAMLEKESKIVELQIWMTDLIHRGIAIRTNIIDEFAEKIKTFYHNLSGKTVGGSVAYHIDQVVKEMKGESE